MEIERGLLELYRDPTLVTEAGPPRAPRWRVLQRSGGPAHRLAPCRDRRRPGRGHPQRGRAAGHARRCGGRGQARIDRDGAHPFHWRPWRRRCAGSSRRCRRTRSHIEAALSGDRGMRSRRSCRTRSCRPDHSEPLLDALLDSDRAPLPASSRAGAAPRCFGCRLAEASRRPSSARWSRAWKTSRRTDFDGVPFLAPAVADEPVRLALADRLEQGDRPGVRGRSRHARRRPGPARCSAPPDPAARRARSRPSRCGGPPRGPAARRSGRARVWRCRRLRSTAGRSGRGPRAGPPARRRGGGCPAPGRPSTARPGPARTAG